MGVYISIRYQFFYIKLIFDQFFVKQRNFRVFNIQCSIQKRYSLSVIVSRRYFLASLDDMMHSSVSDDLNLATSFLNKTLVSQYYSKSQVVAIDGEGERKFVQRSMYARQAFYFLREIPDECDAFS